MGLIVVAIYFPLLLLVSAVAMKLASGHLRDLPRSETSKLRKALPYAFGAIIAISITLFLAWFFSINVYNEFDGLIRRIGISLVGPLVVGALLLMLSAGRDQVSPVSFMTVGALHSTMAMPVIGLLAIVFHDYIAYKPTFDKLCAGVQAVVLEKVEPARSFALAPAWLDSISNEARILLLATNTPLAYVDIRTENDYRHIFRAALLPRESRQSPVELPRWVAITSIESRSAEYEVTFQNITIPPPLTHITDGKLIEVRRAVDKKLIAYSQSYLWRGDHSWDCPRGLRDGSFVRKFIAYSLSLPER